MNELEAHISMLNARVRELEDQVNADRILIESLNNDIARLERELFDTRLLL